MVSKENKKFKKNQNDMNPTHHVVICDIVAPQIYLDNFDKVGFFMKLQTGVFTLASHLI
jgi:hypothetical protein